MAWSCGRPAIVAAFLSVTAAPAALAGGLEANGYNWDLLFDPATYATKASVSYVNIDHPITAGGTTVSNSADRIYYNFAFKGDLTEETSCLVSAQNPWGSGTDRDNAYAALNGLAVSERVRSLDLGLTCAYGIPLGAGVFSILGGVSAQSLDYDADIPTGLATSTPLSVSGQGFGWRVGVAYEIEEIALRVSAVYNAPVSYTLDGTAFGGPASASVSTPQTFELKAQTGVAPGWLVLGSVKWVDWSVLQTMAVNTIGPVITSDLLYRDGWTITAGVAHVITPQLTVLGTVTWDQGTSATNGAGVLLAGAQTDRLGVALGAAYDLSESLELSGGVSYSRLAAGSNLAGETWGAGNVFAINGALKASF